MAGDRDLRDAAMSRRAFEGEVRRALADREFELFYQPQVSMSDGALVGVEALLRWRHPTEGLISPARFLTSIETSPQAAEVGRWVMETACRDGVRLRQDAPGITIGVNLFGVQFRNGGLAAEVRRVLDATGLPAAALELEITENIILRHDEAMLVPLRELRDAGVDIAFDDFGTGFASLSFLKRYPLTRIKIDRSFVEDIGENPIDAAIVNATVYLARALGIDVVAEGIETVAQSDLIRACGCNKAQGYLYGRPMPLGPMMALARTRIREAA